MTTPTTTSGRSSEQQAAPTGVERTFALPRLRDWLENELLAFPRLTMAGREHEMRCEEYLDDDGLVLRVELPGIDPDKDVDVTVADGMLTVHAERRETRKDGGRSEFFYGELVRTFVLPREADEDGVAATYRDGVLEVTVPMTDPQQPAGRKVSVTRGA